MTKRSIVVVFALLLLVLLSAGLWAKMHESDAMPAAKSTDDEMDRCTMTCTMLMDHYNKNFARMKAHEGDSQCWQTCWKRLGPAKSASMEEMKTFWMERRPMNMRANQCAQACWRVNHQDSNTVEVGGWRSEPRDTACAF